MLTFGDKFLGKFLFCAEAVAQSCSVKKVFLEISQNAHENTCARFSFLIKLQAKPTYGNFPENLLKKILPKVFLCCSKL